MPGTAANERVRIRVRGTVQGVGFRPFVYRHAVALGLTGSVCNDSDGVLVEAEGDPRALGELCRRIRDDPPLLARVESVEITTLATRNLPGPFTIGPSRDHGLPESPVSVDTATCAECLHEVDDPGNRRYRYPFTNCTNCGPRYSIVLDIPYDRPATTMRRFVMCDDCQREYDDPGDRRFHAQPNACPSCGPRLLFCEPDGAVRAEADDALERAVSALLAGRILAVKGIGGFHLAVDATDARAVTELRRRKARDDKPFAVMAGDTAQAGRLGVLDDTATALLESHRRPIVLVPRRLPSDLAPQVAPGLPDIGLLLAYTPVHHLLLRGVGRPLVMTSGNLSDDPIAYTDDDAFGRLGPLTDGVLTHDRAIHIRCDDSVVRASGRRSQMVRRSRGYAPEPMALPAAARRQVLAVGAELKNTISVAKGNHVVTSHHIGDLEHLATYRSFLQATAHLCHLYGVEPDVVAHDLHPEYLSTKHALDLPFEPRPVQHHHAHVASCMVEHGRTEPVLGIAFDGLGLGTDGSLWGGEFLIADFGGFERVGHLQAVPLPGGRAAIEQPWRMALAWTRAARGENAAQALAARLDPRGDQVLGLLRQDRSPHVTTSVGRLFDAVSALLGLRASITYEGQAAVELEAQAAGVGPQAWPSFPFEIAEIDGLLVLDPAPLIATIADELERGMSPPVVAAGFHRGLGTATVAMAQALTRTHGLDTVALSGGVFQNVLLSAVVTDGLRDAGLQVLVHEALPANDGGISIGQAAVAALGDPRLP